MLFVLISLTCVSAADDNQTDIVTIENDIIVEELSEGDAGNFKDLKNDIQTSGDVLVLEKDYTYNSDQDGSMGGGITITKSNFVIDGQGHTLDASGKDMRIFDINANNVVLKNIIFTNTNDHGQGGGIYSNNYLTIDNCTFINIGTNQNGGVLYFENGGLVNNSKFLNNGKECYNGGAIYFKTSDATVLNSVFIGNDAYENGGAIYFNGQGTVDKCNFTNNIASIDGGAIFANGNVTISNSNFNDNKARFQDGGAIYFNNGGAVNNCNFTGNNATYKTSPSDGGAILSHGNVTINGTTFENNYADNGGAIANYGNLILENSTFKNNAAKNGLNNISLMGNGQLTTVNVTPENLGPFKLSSLDITDVTTPVNSGTTVNITVNVTSGGKKIERGTVYVIIYNVKYSANVENGKAVISLDGFNTVGKFKETVVYDDDDIYYAKSSLDAEFEILKNDISFDTTVAGAVHKQPFNVTVQVRNNDGIFTNGNVSIIVNNTKYNATIIDGYAKFFNIPGLTAGDQNLLAMFDNETLSASEKVSFKVGKKPVDLIFDVPAIIYCGEVVTIPVQVVDSDEIVNEGQVEFYLSRTKGGTSYGKYLDGDVINGMAYIELPIFEEEYDVCYVRASYEGNFFIQRESVRKYFNTAIREKNLTVNATNVTYGDVVNVNVTVNVKDMTVNTGNVSVTIGNDNYYGIVENGSALVEIPELNAGIYTGTVKYNGPLTMPENSVTFEVYKNDAVLKAEAKSVDYGETVKILANVTTDNNPVNEGNVSVTINGKKYNATVVNGEATIEIPDLNVDDYDCQLTLESVNYQAQDVPVTFKVIEKEASINANVSDVAFGESVKIKVNVTADNNPVNEGNVSVTINGEKYNATVANGEATIEIPDLNPGSYSTQLTFESDNYYAPDAPVSFVVIEKEASISVNVSDVAFGESVKIKVNVTADNNPVNEGNVSVIINGEKYNATVANGEATIEIPGLAVGNYSSEVSFESDNYQAHNAPVSFKVNKKEASISVNASDVVFGETAKILVNVTADKNPVNEGNVSVTINGEKYNATVANGEATIEIPDLTPESYSSQLTFESDNYYAQDAPVSFVVNKKEASFSMNVSDVAFGESLNITVNVTSDGQPVNEGEISVIINGEKYNATVANGNATIEIPGLTVGNYSAEVVYESQNYTAAGQPVKFTILQVIINAEDAKYGVNDNYTYQAKLVDEKGNPLANKSLNFTIDGKTYNATTDNEGLAIVTLTLAVGTYDVVVSYDFAENATANIAILPRIVDNKNLVMDYDNGDFKITALGDDGNPIAGKRVVMKVNGVTYKIKTDDAGIASLPIELKPGTYTITSTYKGTTVKNTIKVKSTLKAVKKTVKVKKTAKKLVLKATLKWSNGKAIVGKKITFKFKGKTYKVKTNKKGIAKLKLKKKVIKKLKKGKKYKAKIIYKNETVTTKVKVKK